MSFGFACFPEDGSDAEKLTHAADVAVYYSKRNGRNRVSWIGEVPASVKLEFAGLEDKIAPTEEPPTEKDPAPPPTAESSDKLPGSTDPGSPPSLEQQIQLGLERNEFEVYYQPQVSLRDGEIVGVEALVRWRHPERGLVMPGEFVPLAEQTRLICQLDLWVLEEACRQVQIWNLDRPANHPLMLSVNLSARNLEEERLPETIAQALAKTRLNPHWLQLELTETVFAEISEANIHLLQRLKELGLGLAIDDFGTGFAGMNYLRFFPVDTLKIARSFVQSLDASPKSKAIVESIIGLGRNLKLAIVAEGVEDGKEVACLNAWGCKLIQGYYFARPMPRAEFEALIKPGLQNSSNSIPALKKKPIELAQFQVS
jgi:EAL domain-containing protein (putative c-di-GMP-specific phosphodiesterase class I)